MHKRRAVLEQIKAMVAPLAPGGTVWITRGKPPREGKPAFTIYDESENCEITTFHQIPRQQARKLTVVVNGWTTYGTGDIEKSEIYMDDLAAMIEETIVLPSGADDIQLINTEKILDEEDPKISVVTMTYQVVYQSKEQNPQI